MKKSAVITAVILSFIFFPENVSAQVVINEVLNNPAGKEDGAEWVELYNKSEDPQSLKNCVLYLDSTSTNQKVEFREEDFIEKFKVVSWDGTMLNNQGDTVKLVCPDFNDQLLYGNETGSLLKSPEEGITVGRSPDGYGNFMILSNPTVNEANSLPPSATTTLTPTFSPSPKPTPAAKVNTATPTAAKTPTVSISQIPATFTPTVKVSSVTPEVTESTGSTDSAFVLGITESATAPVAERLMDEKIQKPQVIPLSIIISGILISIFSLFRVIKNVRKSYNSVSDENKK